MNILLINPFQALNINRFFHRFFPVANITPHYLASLIPGDHRIRVIDEARQKLDFDQPAELVFISTLTLNANHAYRIADQFRRRGRMVVLGGPHASARPEEAARHADAVVIGSAESLMPQIIDDASNLRLQARYQDCQPSELPATVMGRATTTWQTSILASRGCELQCSFCSSQNIFGKFYLQRPIEKVLADIAATETRYINFLDDNFYGASAASNAYYDQILQALAKKKVSWLAQVRLPILTNEVLAKFRASNCAGFLIGFESINPDNTREVGKKVDAEFFRDEIARIHAHGIGVVGSFIFGFDEDTPETIDNTIDFCIDSRLELAAFSILTPYPGTRIYRDLQTQDRIISHNWDDYDCDKVVFQPKNFTPQELAEHKLRAVKRFYSWSSIYKRMKFDMNYDTFRMFLAPNLLRKYALIGKKETICNLSPEEQVLHAR